MRDLLVGLGLAVGFGLVALGWVLDDLKKLDLLDVGFTVIVVAYLLLMGYVLRARE